MLGAAPLGVFDDGTPVFTADDLLARAIAVRRGNDGLHLLWHRAQLFVSPPAHPRQPLVALISMAGNLARRIAAMIDVQRMLTGQPPTRERLPTAQTVRRHLLRLRALDGSLAGASHREIATALFGARVPAGAAWRTSEYRSRTLRLVADGRRLMTGGYLDLLG